MVSEVGKGGKNMEKYSPEGLSRRSHAAKKKKIAKFQVSAEFIVFLPIEMCPGAGHLHLEQVLMPVFSAPTSSSLERLKCESKKKSPNLTKLKWHHI